MSIQKVLNQNFKDETQLLLHLDGSDGSTTITDSSSNNASFSISGNPELDTAWKKFGTASLVCDGTGYVYNNDPINSAWELTNFTNTTFDFWVKHSNTTGTQRYFEQREDGTHQWAFDNNGAGNLEWYIYVSAYKVRLTATGINDTNAHHLAMCKVGNDYGLYLDGTQVAYQSHSTSYDLNNLTFYIGNTPAGVYGFKGNLDEIRLTQNNKFGASPNSGLTDTITVPTSADANLRIKKVMNTLTSDITKISGISG